MNVVEITEDTDVETGQSLRSIHTLPPELVEYVREDNRHFMQELEEWNDEQVRKIPQKELVAMSAEQEAGGSTAEGNVVLGPRIINIQFWI